MRDDVMQACTFAASQRRWYATPTISFFFFFFSFEKKVNARI